MSRLNWNEYFLEILTAAEKRVSCNRGTCAAVFVKDNEVLATGYAGSPSKFPHCTEVGCDMEERIRYVTLENLKLIERYKPSFMDLDNRRCININGLIYNWNEDNNRYETNPKQGCVRTIHAEQNAIIQAAKRGISLKDSTIFVTMTPCRVCAMFVISVGVKNIICKQRYHAGAESEEMFRVANIPIEFKDESILQYAKST